MEIIAMVVVSLSNMLCFLLGLHASGRTVLPRRERKEARQERQRVETILRNVDRFDGTGFGQEEV